MGEGEGAVRTNESGTVEFAFFKIVGVDACGLPEESGAGFDVFGFDGGGEGVSFLEGC